MRSDYIENLGASPIKLTRVPPVIRERLEASERAVVISEIKRLLKREDAVIVAHYYTDPEIQALADETGGHVSDSLDMAHFGNQHAAQTLIVAGVRFMGRGRRPGAARFGRGAGAL